mgnify:CR=1 FL=1
MLRSLRYTALQLSVTFWVSVVECSSQMNVPKPLFYSEFAVTSIHRFAALSDLFSTEAVI